MSDRKICEHHDNWFRGHGRIYCDECASEIELVSVKTEHHQDDVGVAIAYDKVKMHERDLVFVDVETTGLDSDVHEIIQIGARVRHASKPGSIGGETIFKCFVAPAHIELAEKQALEVNGYSSEAWTAAGAVPIVEAIKFFRRACLGRPCIMLAWNPTFDKPFIKRAFTLWEGRLPKAVDYHWLDVASMAWPLVESKVIDTVKLDKVCDYFGIPNVGKHDALVDVERMLKVYDRLRQDGWNIQRTVEYQGA